jgi:hypothetical protein
MYAPPFAALRFQACLLLAISSSLITFSTAFAPLPHPKQQRWSSFSFSPPLPVSASKEQPLSLFAAVESHMSPNSSSATIDCSTLTLLEHVNLNVPHQADVLPFYWGILGCGMDPRKAANLKSDAEKKTLWANCGASQFHLPYGVTAQRIPGTIGLRYDSLDKLKARLLETPPTTGSTYSYEIVERNGQEVIHLTDCHGNVFHCRAGGSRVDATLRQPIIAPTETEEWGDAAVQYGRDESDCRGIDYVEFKCPVGTAAKIAIFYESIFDATSSVVQDGDTDIAIVAFGNVDETGKSDQSLLFRETDEVLPPYDGHHIAMYVGKSEADYEQAFKNAASVDVVWVNPRFDDKADTLQGAREWKQFRFKDILDMETGEKIFELEHEMRSVEHKAWPGERIL